MVLAVVLTADGSNWVELVTADPVALAYPSTFAADLTANVPPAVIVRPLGINAFDVPRLTSTAIAPATLTGELDELPELEAVAADGAEVLSVPLSALLSVPVAFLSCALPVPVPSFVSDAISLFAD